jgi:hypothetical protein
LKESTTSIRKALPTIDASPLRVADDLTDQVAKVITSQQPQQQQTASARQQVSKENINVHHDRDYHHSNDKLNPSPTNPIRSPSNTSVSLTPTKIPRPAPFRPQKSANSPLPKIRSDEYYPHPPPSNDDLLSSPRRKDKISAADTGILDNQDHTNDFGVMTTGGHQLQLASSQSVFSFNHKRASGIQGSLIPRSRSGASNTSKTLERLSNNDLKADSNKPSTISEATTTIIYNQHHHQQHHQQQHSSDEAAGTESSQQQHQDTSAAARLAAARRTVAKSQEVQSSRVASRRLSTTVHPSGDQTSSSDFGASVTSSTTGVMASSRSSRTIASKLTIPSRMSRSSTTPSMLSPSEAVGHTSRSSPGHSLRGGRVTDSKGNMMSPTISEEESKGDEEMAQYVARQRTKKLMSGMTPGEVAKLFEFPKPIEPTQPMTTQEALRLYKNYLSDYEKGEILSYEKIYYVGSESVKKMASEDKPAQNYGYDDERGDYQIVKTDHLIYRYEIVDVLGKGSFGQVLQCRDHSTGDMVAIKIIRNKRRFHHQALVEIRVLENLLSWVST